MADTGREYLEYIDGQKYINDDSDDNDKFNKFFREFDECMRWLDHDDESNMNYLIQRLTDFSSKIKIDYLDLTKLFQNRSWDVRRLLLHTFYFKNEFEKRIVNDKQAKTDKTFNKQNALLLLDIYIDVLNSGKISQISKDQIDKYFNDKMTQSVKTFDVIITEKEEKMNISEKSLEETQKRIQKEISSMYNQIISIIGIFTAVIFVIFGGLQTLEFLFASAISDLQFSTLIRAGVVLSLVIFNITWLLLFIVLLVSNVANIDYYKSKMRCINIIWNTVCLLIFIISLYIK